MASEKLKEVMEAQSDDAKMDMSPMIDMVFLLLIFFMVASTLIVNRLDPHVIPSTADKAQPVDQAAGRIVINIYSDESIESRKKADSGYSGATYTNEAGEPLDGEDQLNIYISAQVEELRNTKPGVKPKILLRGDKRALVKQTKIVTRAAGAAGVDDIIFSTYQVDPT